MKQVLQHVRSGALEIVDVPEPATRAGAVVVRNHASLISAGTEKMVIEFAGKSLLGKARERPDLVRQVLDKVRKDGVVPTAQAVLTRLDQPIALGYSCAGVVERVGRGAEEFAAGDRVACAGMGYASHAGVVSVPRNLTVRVPDAVSLEDASYVTLGAIALQGVRIADVRLGANVVVIGLGLLGLLTVQILRACGCRVVGIDLDPSKVELASSLGAHLALERGDGVEERVREFTGGTGVDAVLIAAATDSNDPVKLAGDLCRDRGSVTVVGAVRMDVPRKVYYEKELDLRLSRSYGPGRYDPEYEEHGRDYPIGYVRWTERRNMQEFLRLVAAGHATPAALTTHRFPIDRAEDAYALITGDGGEPFTGVVLTYSGNAPARVQEERTVRMRSPFADRSDGKVGVAFVGAGNFARSVLLPAFERAAGVRPVGIATSSGTSARSAAQKFGFEYATTDIDRLMEDDSVDAVVIATRHDSHAGLVARALRAGKNVFVEKPLAIDEAGLQEVVEAQAQTGALVAVGFNRRFSPLSVGLKNAFPPGVPLAIDYRVNAGPIPRESWIQSAEEGGGRIVGEVCHFVDLVQFITGEDPVVVHTQGIGGSGAEFADTVSISMRLSGGSMCTINYFANGDRSLAKERIEVFGAGRIAILDDFRRLTIVEGGRRRKSGGFRQEKGFDAEVEAFLGAVRGAAPPPIPFESLVATTRTTFAAVEALRRGTPVDLIGGEA